ncbi:Zinc finger, RING/FYVE/PHD-type [Artemisia annua]|uniref:Zinc finger, RING/FYVE/PHD-type n=1 Tax=Artemisia annua TaxID=35608 RepID=A0A2U1PMI0_ARTAN|nr:Zinc finger, RING/FYVE/PHD-type [Artemisia annua]
MVLEIVTSMVLLFVGIAVLVIIHICIANSTFGMTQDNIENSTVVQRSNTLSEDDIKKLPLYYYMLNEDDAEDVKRVDCAVCLECFKDGDKCRLLPNCRHSFHASCIDSWLIKSVACPICRTCVDLERSRGESTF